MKFGFLPRWMRGPMPKVTYHREGPEGPWVVNDVLAKSVEMSEDGKTLTIHLGKIDGGDEVTVTACLDEPLWWRRLWARIQRRD